MKLIRYLLPAIALVLLVLTSNVLGTQSKPARFIVQETFPIDGGFVGPEGGTLPKDAVLPLLTFPVGAVSAPISLAIFDVYGRFENADGFVGAPHGLRLDTKAPLALSRPIEVAITVPDDLWGKVIPVPYEVSPEEAGCMKETCRAGTLMNLTVVRKDPDHKQVIFSVWKIPATVVWGFVPLRDAPR